MDEQIQRKMKETMMKECLDVQQESLILLNQRMEENDDEMLILILMNQIEVSLNIVLNLVDIHQDENDRQFFSLIT